jgi:hypothetical protein
MLSLAMALSLATVHAQVQIGIKAGFNFAHLSGSDVNGVKSLTSFNGGLLLNAPLGHRLSLQPELLYSGQGAQAQDNSGTLHLGYINVPVLLKLMGPEGLFSEIGPQLGILTSASLKSGINSVDVKSGYSSTDISAVVGFGYYAKSAHIGIDLRYNFGLANIENHSSSISSGGTVKNNVFQVGMFILFPGK